MAGSPLPCGRGEACPSERCDGQRNESTETRTAALESLWRTSGSELQRLCRHWLEPDTALVDEALSRVAMTMVRKFPATEVRNPRAWLIRVARNICVDIRRERNRMLAEPLPSPDEEHYDSALCNEVTPEAESLQREREARLRRAIAGLPRRLRQTVILGAIGGLSYSEIASRLAITEATARKRMQHARALLAIAMRADDRDGGGRRARVRTSWR